jgi:hypothetical protein
MKTFNYYSDPGHGWLKVPLSLLDQLGITNKITRYSHTRKGFAYLEEDQDASTFMEAFRARFGISPKIREYCARSKSSKIRSYDHFNEYTCF